MKIEHFEEKSYFENFGLFWTSLYQNLKVGSKRFLKSWNSAQKAEISAYPKEESEKIGPPRSAYPPDSGLEGLLLTMPLNCLKNNTDGPHDSKWNFHRELLIAGP